MKITSGSNEEISNFVDKLYSSIVTAGTYKASSIRVAEAAKVIENVQRDVNIALINELAILFDKLKIDTEEVLEAAETKWNFCLFAQVWWEGIVLVSILTISPIKHKQLITIQR